MALLVGSGKRPGRAVQVEGIKTRVDSAYGFNAGG